MNHRRDERHLLRAAQDAGWRTRPSTDGWLIYPPSGAPPIPVHRSRGSDWRLTRNLAAQLRRAGLPTQAAGAGAVHRPSRPRGADSGGPVAPILPPESAPRGGSPQNRKNIVDTHKPAHLGGRINNWSRRRKLAAVGGVAAAFVAGAVVAWALLALRADIEGGGDIAAPSNLEFTAANVASETDVDCTTSITGGDLSLQMANGLTNGRCDVTMTLRRTGQSGAPQTINGLTFANEVDERFLNGVCAGTVVPSEGVTVTARFTLTGSPGPFTALADAGITTTDEPQLTQTAPPTVVGCPA